jgi:hypothetical protein
MKSVIPSDSRGIPMRKIKVNFNGILCGIGFQPMCRKIHRQDADATLLGMTILRK